MHPIPITIIGGPIGKWVIWWPNWKSALAWSLWTQRVLLIVTTRWSNSYNHWQTAESASFSPAELEEEERWGKGAGKCSLDLIFKSWDIFQFYHYSISFCGNVEMQFSRLSKSLSKLKFYQHNCRKWEKSVSDWNWGVKIAGREDLCVWGCHNSTFTHLSDLTALEGQRQWPSCMIPISWVCATVEMKRDPCLYRAPGLSDYCLKTRGFAHDKDWSAHTQGVPGPSCSLSPAWRAGLIFASLTAFFVISTPNNRHNNRLTIWKEVY